MPKKRSHRNNVSQPPTLTSNSDPAPDSPTPATPISEYASIMLLSLRSSNSSRIPSAPQQQKTPPLEPVEPASPGQRSTPPISQRPTPTPTTKMKWLDPNGNPLNLSPSLPSPPSEQPIITSTVAETDENSTENTDLRGKEKALKQEINNLNKTLVFTANLLNPQYDGMRKEREEKIKELVNINKKLSRPSPEKTIKKNKKSKNSTSSQMPPPSQTQYQPYAITNLSQPSGPRFSAPNIPVINNPPPPSSNPPFATISYNNQQLSLLNLPPDQVIPGTFFRGPHPSRTSVSQSQLPRLRQSPVFQASPPPRPPFNNSNNNSNVNQTSSTSSYGNSLGKKGGW